MVDEARIRQVLANLLANVREHTPAQTPVAVRLAPVRGGVVLEVADAGPGMPPAGRCARVRPLPPRRGPRRRQADAG
jgi:C4-dicarboxylate-specific signal transduction histidine kinase